RGPRSNSSSTFPPAWRLNSQPECIPAPQQRPLRNGLSSLSGAQYHPLPPFITGVAVRGTSIQHSAQKSDHIVQDLVLICLIEDFVLRPRVDVLFDIASPQEFHCRGV